MDASKLKRGLRFVIVGSAAVLVAILTLYAINRIPISFERTRWLRAAEEGNWRVRTRMAEDLISRGLIIGKSRNELIAMLGQPEKYSDAKENELYYLVREDWSAIDPVRVDNLLITTDQNGRAVNVAITVFKK